MVKVKGQYQKSMKVYESEKSVPHSNTSNTPTLSTHERSIHIPDSGFTIRIIHFMCQ